MYSCLCQHLWLHFTNNSRWNLNEHIVYPLKSQQLYSQCPWLPTCVQGDRADIVELGQSVDLHLQLLVVLDLGLVLWQLGVLLVELNKVILSVFFPDWVIARESVQGSSHLLIKYQVKFLLLNISYQWLSISMSKKSQASSVLPLLL